MQVGASQNPSNGNELLRRSGRWPGVTVLRLGTLQGRQGHWQCHVERWK